MCAGRRSSGAMTRPPSPIRSTSGCTSERWAKPAPRSSHPRCCTTMVVISPHRSWDERSGQSSVAAARTPCPASLAPRRVLPARLPRGGGGTAASEAPSPDRGREPRGLDRLALLPRGGPSALHRLRRETGILRDGTATGADGDAEHPAGARPSDLHPRLLRFARGERDHSDL